MNVLRLLQSIAVAVALIGLAPAAVHADGSKVATVLTNTGVDPDASGKVALKLQDGKSRLDVKLRSLDPSTLYTLSVDGLPWTTFQPDKGSARLRFAAPADNASDLPLPADPRGATIAVNDGVDDVLTGVVSGSGESPSSKVKEASTLAATTLGAGGEARTTFRQRKSKSRLDLKVKNADAGDYTVLIDGIDRGTMSAPKGKGKLSWSSESSPRKLPLDFDPRGGIVEVEGPGGIFFSGPVNGQVAGVNACTFAETESPLTPEPAAGAGSGDSRLRIRDDCRRDFDVEIEDVPVGDYDLFVDGVFRGTITVVDLGGGDIEGELEFTTEPDEIDELFLDFDPAGALIEVEQGGTLFFSGTQGEPQPGGGGTTPCTPSEVELPLLNTGVIANAKGDARLRVRDDCDEDFRVEIEDVPVGDYDILVGGTPRGTISAVNTGSEVEGQIEFDTDPDEPGEQLLNFDPRGQLIQIRDGGANTILERDFP
jgi:hypothetical protein